MTQLQVPPQTAPLTPTSTKSSPTTKKMKENLGEEIIQVVHIFGPKLTTHNSFQALDEEEIRSAYRELVLTERRTLSDSQVTSLLSVQVTETEMEHWDPDRILLGSCVLFLWLVCKWKHMSKLKADLSDTEESGPDSQELPASEVLGHGLWLVPCGLCWGSQCGGIQKLESLCIARDGQHVSNGVSIGRLPSGRIWIRRFDFKISLTLLPGNIIVLI